MIESISQLTIFKYHLQSMGRYKHVLSYMHVCPDWDFVTNLPISNQGQYNLCLKYCK